MNAPPWSRLVITLAAVVAGVVLVALGVTAVPGAMPASRGAGSSWSDRPTGWSGYARLLTATEREVRADARRVADLQLADPASLVVVAAPGDRLSEPDWHRLAELVDGGARVLLATDRPNRLFRARGVVLEDRPLAGPAVPGALSPLAPRLGELAGHGTVVAQAVPGMVPVWALPPESGGGVRVGVLPSGDGELVLLTDPSVLSNAFLTRPGHLDLALALAPREHPVVFAEGVHGRGTLRGLAAWLWREGRGLLVGEAALVALLAVWRVASTAHPHPTALPHPPPSLAELAGAAARLGLEGAHHGAALQRVVREGGRRLRTGRRLGVGLHGQAVLEEAARAAASSAPPAELVHHARRVEALWRSW